MCQGLFQAYEYNGELEHAFKELVFKGEGQANE